MLEGLLKAYVRTLLESGELKEFCSLGSGAIQGYTLPLGMSPVFPAAPASKKRKKKNRKK